MTYTFHLIANAHLDRLGSGTGAKVSTRGLVTCRAVLDLMDTDPDLTFIRGEAAIYAHIEREDPETFARIQSLYRGGPVGCRRRNLCAAGHEPACDRDPGASLHARPNVFPIPFWPAPAHCLGRGLIRTQRRAA